MNFPKRGEIWLVSFDSSVGAEIRKVRPALIVSNDIANARSAKITVVPLTSTIRENPLVVIVEPDRHNGLEQPSLIRVPDVTTFDKRRLGKKIGVLKPNLLRQVESRLRLHLQL